MILDGLLIEGMVSETVGKMVDGCDAGMITEGWTSEAPDAESVDGRLTDGWVAEARTVGLLDKTAWLPGVMVPLEGSTSPLMPEIDSDTEGVPFGAFTAVDAGVTTGVSDWASACSLAAIDGGLATSLPPQFGDAPAVREGVEAPTAGVDIADVIAEFAC